MEPSLRISLLGNFRVTVLGRPVPYREWQKRKARVLVQALALQSTKSMHRDELIELLFPETSDRAASENFYRVLYAARRALKPAQPHAARSEFLSYEGKQIVLAHPDAVQTDVDNFERAARDGLRKNDGEQLTAAEMLYEDDLLAYEPIEDWMVDPRERLRGVYHAVVRRMAEQAEARGDRTGAHQWLDKALSVEPADEAAHRAKMQLYAGACERSLALRQYEICARALQRELDVEPEPETEHLRQKIINNGRISG